MSTSIEIRRGQSVKSLGVDSDILLGPTITAANLAYELARYPRVQPGTVAWNRIWHFDPSSAGAIYVMLDVDGKWYGSDGKEVV